MLESLFNKSFRSSELYQCFLRLQHVFFCEMCEIFWNTFFCRTPPVAVSGMMRKKNLIRRHLNQQVKMGVFPSHENNIQKLIRFILFSHGHWISKFEAVWKHLQSFVSTTVIVTQKPVILNPRVKYNVVNALSCSNIFYIQHKVHFCSFSHDNSTKYYKVIR